MSAEVPSIKGLKIRPEVLEGRYEPAIILSSIVRATAPKFLLDPVEFFKRTHVTETMRTLIVKTLMGLLGKTRAEVGGKTYTMHNKLLVLPSLFGGGKSHSLAVLYHLLNLVKNAESPEKAKAIISILDKDIAEFIYENWNELKSIGIKVVVVDCGEAEFAPVPEDEKPIKTLWGYIASQLGRYSRIARYDEKAVAPPKDVLREILDASGAVILIDEIARYYSRTRELGKDLINEFLMNLSEVLTTEEVRGSVVIITLPYDVERGVVEEAHADVVKPEVIKKIIDRVGSGNTIPVVTTVDLPSILRKRIFEEDEDVLREYGRKLADKIYDRASDVAKQIINKREGRLKLRGELEETYPFHPETINVLRLLHTYLSKYIQATRNPIRMASEAILAIREGFFDWMGYTPYLIMPFHILVFLENVLIECFPLMFSEFAIFREILKKDVVHPIRELGEEVKLGDNIVEKIPSELHIPSFMITAYVWLRSLAGGGYLSRAEAYPTTNDIAYSLIDLETARNEEWMDVSKILRGLHGKLTYLAEHADRWLFRRMPFLDQLIERYARDILPNAIYEELTSYLNALREKEKAQYRVEVLKDTQYVYIKYGEEAELPDELDVNRLTIVVFAREASDEEVSKVLERNNIVVLKPDTEREISEEDLKAKLELKRYRTYWEALKEALRYLKACEKVTDDILRTEFTEEIRESEEVLALLKAKRDQYQSDYVDLVSFLLPRVYHSVILKRAGKLKPLEGLMIKSDAPLSYAIEVVLKNNNYLRKELSGNELEEIIKEYLKVDLRERKEGVVISDIWNLFLTNNTIEEIPIIPYDGLLNAVFDLIRSLDYGVKINNEIYWKKIYSSKEEANAIISAHNKDIGEDTIKDLKKLLTSIQVTGETAKIIYWEHLLDEWLNRLKPKDGYRIAVLTPSREVKTIEELKTEYNWGEVLKDSALFYEEIKVDIELETPLEVSVGEEFTADLKISSRAYSGRVSVEITSPDIEVSEKRFESELPIEKKLIVKIPEDFTENRVSITIAVYSERGEELGRKTITLTVGRRGPEGPVGKREWLGKKSVRKLIEEGKQINIYGLRTSNLGNLVKIARLVSDIPSQLELELSVWISNIGGAREAEISFTVKGLPMNSISLIQGVVMSISDLGEIKASIIVVKFDKPVPNLKELEEFPDDVEFDIEYEEEDYV